MAIYIIPLLTILALIVFLYILISSNFKLESVLLCILYLLPFLDMKVTTTSWGGLKLFDLFIIICIYIFFKHLYVTWKYSIFSMLALLIILLMVVSAISTLVSEFPHNIFIKLFKLSTIFVFSHLFLVSYKQNPEFRSSSINAIKIAIIFSIAFLYLQVAFGLNLKLYDKVADNTFDPVNNQFRYPGIFYDSQASGQFLALSCFYFLNMKKNISGFKRNLNLIIFFLICIAALLAGSRSALGGLIIGLVVYSLLKSVKASIITLCISFILGCLLVGNIIPLPKILKRTESLNQDYQYRESLWKDALGITQKHHLLGIGLDNYKEYIIKHLPNQHIELEDGTFLYFDQPENGYLKILVELGLIGLVLFLLIIIIPFTCSIWRYISGNVDSGILCSIASLISWLVAFNTVYSIYDYRILIMVVCQILFILIYPSITNNKFENLKINI